MTRTSPLLRRRAPGSRTRATEGTSPASRPAQRARQAGWRDPRLALGVLLVAACVVAGARILATADDTVAVWSAKRALAQGTELDPVDLEAQRIRFSSEQSARGYLPAGSPVPKGLVLARPVGGRELVPRAALARPDMTELVELPVTVPAENVPDGLTVGERVDVWVAPDQLASGEVAAAGPARQALTAVPVLALPASGTALGPAATRQVLVGVPSEDEEALATAIGDTARGVVVLVGRP